MIHDARSNYGRNNANAALAPPTPTQYLKHQIQEKRNRMIENAIRDRNEIQKTYEQNPFVQKGVHMNSARGNPTRKVRPVIGNSNAASPTGNSNRVHNERFGNGGSSPKTSSLFGNGNDLSIQIDNDNFHGGPQLVLSTNDAPSRPGGAPKSKRDLIWEQKRLKKLQALRGGESGSSNSVVREPPSMSRSKPPPSSIPAASSAHATNSEETTRDRIYRQKREKFLRDSERQMGKRHDVSPTHNDLYDFSGAHEPSPPSPPSRITAQPSSTSQQQFRRQQPSPSTKDNIYGNTSSTKHGPPLNQSSSSYRNRDTVSKSPTQQWNDIASRPPISSTHSKRPRRNSFGSPVQDASHLVARGRFPGGASPDAQNYRRQSSPMVSPGPGDGLFGKLGEHSSRPKKKFNHDIPQNPSTFHSHRDERHRLIRNNEQMGGLFGNLGNNNDQQRYVARQQSPGGMQNMRSPVPPPGRPTYLSPLKRHSSPSPLSPSHYQIGLSHEDQQRQKALKQQEYARALEQQIRAKKEEKRIRRDASAPSRSPLRQQPQHDLAPHQRSPPTRSHRANTFADDRSPPHRDRYSAQHSPPYAGRSPGSPRYVAGPSEQMGLSAHDEKRKKMLKQQEYQRALQEQIRIKEQQQKEGQTDPLRGGISRLRTREPAPIDHRIRQPPNDYYATSRSPVNQRQGRSSPPQRQQDRYESYPSPSHHVDRVPLRHDLPPEHMPRKISTNDLRSSRERRHDMRQKQEYGDYLKQQMEEKKRREQEEKRKREDAEIKHERQALNEGEPQPARSQPNVGPARDGPQNDNDMRAGFDKVASGEPHKRDLFGPPSPEQHGAMRGFESQPPISSPSHLSSPSNAHRGLLRYSEPAAVEEKRKRMEKQQALKTLLEQQMKEKKEKERLEKEKIEQEEERERLRFEKEQAELKQQKEKEELEKKRAAQEEEATTRRQAEETRRQRDEDEKRKIQLEEEKFARDQQQMQRPSSPHSDNARNDLFGNDDHATVTFPQPAAAPSKDDQTQEDDPHAHMRRRPSRPQMASNAGNARALSHRALVTPSEMHEDDSRARQQFQNVQKKIDGFKPRENEDALRADVVALNENLKNLTNLIVQQQESQMSRQSTPDTSRRMIDPKELEENAVRRSTQKKVGLRPSPVPNRSKSPKKMTSTKRMIPSTGRSEMMSVGASRAFDQSIEAHSEFLFPTALSARRSISRPPSSQPYIYHSSGGLEHDDEDDLSTYRPDTAVTDYSEAASEANTVATMDTDRLARKNRIRVSQLEKLEAMHDDDEKEQLMERYLQTGKIDDSNRPLTAQSLPGTSQSILPTRNDKNLPSILHDPFGDGAEEAPVYKRLNSARSNLSEISSLSQRPDSRRSSRPSSRRSSRPSSRHRSTRQRSMSTPRYNASRVSTAESNISARPASRHRHRRSSSARKNRPIVEQSLSSHSTFIMRPDIDGDE
mmetsp:Transcript_3734/g.14169  ORF Transcript_3734/g.14169 Transcript_3734/m.14169 type:complete len:1447 (-) Transcript_3734:48-4388(-)|eukprot:CAMPEP_0117450300 /NCGR_PEP_ID=MMETSP0759-20121206/8394_1 /TAXON_ID=63605 /ORGANISM="Percolomonas cosmopolitus, Strain WS" /LENGTH=1446 /DNA_ID=CAMNT_0005242811 /DNA_START=257 /DNA_END=4594 /DNA_ORIENTATION=+